jgi:hypothetical protein
MSKHTPGPWAFLEEGRTEEDGNRCRPLTICGPNHDDLANVYSSDDATVSIPRSEAIANARLFAAAPDMLQTLRDLDGWLDNSGFTDAHPWRISIRAAIAKATGEPA